MDRKAKQSKSAPASALSAKVGTTQRFRITYTTVVSADAGGALASVLTLDPSSYTEYASIADLYGEIRLKSSKLHICNIQIVDSGFPLIQRNMPVGCDLSITSTAPTSQAGVWSIAGARPHPSQSPERHTYVAKIPNMSWASTANPAPGPYAGCYGAWQIFRNGLTANAAYFDAYLENEYEVRARR